jgi:hypothetical protein
MDLSLWIDAHTKDNSTLDLQSLHVDSCQRVLFNEQNMVEWKLADAAVLASTAHQMSVQPSIEVEVTKRDDEIASLLIYRRLIPPAWLLPL